MTYTQLKIFITIIDTGSFTKAGQILNMTQPAISHAISSLEDSLGIKLIIRDRRNGLIVSEVGSRIALHARNIVDSYHSIEEEAHAVKKLASGSINIASFPSASSHFVVRLISDFHKQYPNIEVNLLDGSYVEVEDMLRTRSADIGITVAPENNDLEFKSILLDPLHVTFPIDHPFHNLEKIPLARLDDEVILMTKGFEAPIIQLLRQSSVKAANVKSILNTNTIFKMVEEGLGISIVGSIAVPTTTTNIQRREMDPPNFRNIGISCISFRDLSYAAQLFVRLLLEHFKG